MVDLVSGKTELANLIPQIWSPQMYLELRNSLVFGSIFSREYEGDLKQLGDTVKVNQIVAPTGEILTSDKDTFSPEVMTVNQFSVTVNKRAVASFEFTDLAKLQSQEFEAMAREALTYSIQKQIESDIITLLVPSASAPDHQISPASPSDLAAADVAATRTLLSQAKVPRLNRWFVADPAYYGDLLLKQNFVNSQYIPNSAPTASGEFSSPLYGFKIMEHDLLAADTAYGFHPSALNMVMQQELELKISDQHVNHKFGYVMSANIVYGLQLFDNKRIVKITG